MKKTILYSSFALLSALFCGADALAQGSADDEKTIRAQAQDFMNAFAKGDSKAISELWTKDGVLLTVDGREFRGRENIEGAYRGFFDDAGKQPLAVSIESITFPSPDVAIERGTSILARATTPGAAGRYVAIHLKKNGQWLMDSVTETAYQAASNKEYLQELDWLVGDWIIENGTQKRRLKAEWGPKRNFVILTFSSTAGEIEEREIIGWNPLRKQLSAWHFNTDGGWGYSDWYKSGNSWILSANAVEPDGTTGHANYNLSRVDANNFTLHSTDRWLQNQRLADTGTIKISRDKDAATNRPANKSAAQE